MADTTDKYWLVAFQLNRRWHSGYRVFNEAVKGSIVEWYMAYDAGEFYVGIPTITMVIEIDKSEFDKWEGAI